MRQLSTRDQNNTLNCIWWVLLYLNDNDGLEEQGEEAGYGDRRMEEEIHDYDGSGDLMLVQEGARDDGSGDRT